MFCPRQNLEKTDSETRYRALTLQYADMLRAGKAKPDDCTVDSMLRQAAEQYNERRSHGWSRILPWLRLPAWGWFSQEVTSRSHVAVPKE